MRRTAASYCRFSAVPAHGKLPWAFAHPMEDMATDTFAGSEKPHAVCTSLMVLFFVRRFRIKRKSIRNTPESRVFFRVVLKKKNPGDSTPQASLTLSVRQAGSRPDRLWDLRGVCSSVSFQPDDPVLIAVLHCAGFPDPYPPHGLQTQRACVPAYRRHRLE